jgi:ribosomal protein S2
MEKGSIRMGIIYLFKKINAQKHKKSNKSIKNSFYLTLSFFGSKSNISNTNINIHLLGKKKKFSIINTEHHVEMLKRAVLFLREVSKVKGGILFVNAKVNIKFDGMIKIFSIRALEQFYIGKWLGGCLTRKISKLPYKALIVYNPKKSIFLIKEANKLGLPMISLCTANILETTYPIICNNSNGNSLLYSSLILSNAIIESKLYFFVKNTFVKKLY